jgi:hypothetical protein
MAKRAAGDTVQVKVRMREDLRRKLEREAEKRGTTINAEILHRLDASFEDRMREIVNLASQTATTAAVQAIRNEFPFVDWKGGKS